MTRITLTIEHQNRKETYTATSESENFAVLGPLGRVLNAAIANHRDEIRGIQEALEILKAWFTATNQPVDAMTTTGDFDTHQEAAAHLQAMFDQVQPAQPTMSPTECFTPPNAPKVHLWAAAPKSGNPCICGEVKSRVAWSTLGNRGPGTNTGHGWIWPRPDGFKSVCGGPETPSQCAFCLADLHEYRDQL